MITVDTNILVYAHRRDSEWHAASSATVRALAQGRSAWAIPWPCLHEFLAIVTHPRIFDPPTRMTAALDQVAAWLESPSLTLLSEGPGYPQQLSEVLKRSKVSGARFTMHVSPRSASTTA
jgi:uncharacterized protein